MEKKLCFPAFIAAGILILGLLPLRWTLEVKEKRSGEVFLRERVHPGDRFQFQYTHSVEKTPVEILFEIEQDCFFRVVETRFASPGPGLPAVGERDLAGDGRFVSKEGIRQERVTFLFVSLNHPLLTIRNREIRLLPKHKDGGALEFSVRRGPWLVDLREIPKHIFRNWTAALHPSGEERTGYGH